MFGALRLEIFTSTQPPTRRRRHEPFGLCHLGLMLILRAVAWAERERGGAVVYILYYTCSVAAVSASTLKCCCSEQRLNN
jgi:hypothetical protein